MASVTPHYETLLVETVRPHVLLVTMNRPEVGNAKNTRMGEEMLALWTGLIAQPGDIRCVVLTGAGEKIFSAGGDLKARKGMTDEQWQHQHEIFERGRDALLELPMPIIAAVNGHAYGGGTEAVLACDFAYAVRTARFALTEVTVGIMPGGGGTQLAPRAMGSRRAMEFICTGAPIGAEQALEWGILNKVCEPGTLMETVLATAEKIAANAPLSIRQAKKSIRAGMQTDLRTGLMFEIEAYNRLVTTEDRREGVLAFNEKRKPVWKAR
jgi:enoyl-CoA hydratase